MVSLDLIGASQFCWFAIMREDMWSENVSLGIYMNKFFNKHAFLEELNRCWDNLIKFLISAFLIKLIVIKQNNVFNHIISFHTASLKPYLGNVSWAKI